MLLTNNINYFKMAKYFSAQAKEEDVFFVHNNVGFNYRMTNISAALGIEQIKNINKILRQKRIIKDLYSKYFSKIKGVKFFNGPTYSLNNNWMNLVQVKSLYTKSKSLKKIINLFEKKRIQLRPVWNLNHTQNLSNYFKLIKLKMR